MPIYEYICECGHEFEILVANSRTKPQCPQCGSKKLSRQFSTFAAHGSPARPASCADAGCGGGQSPCQGGRCPFSG